MSNGNWKVKSYRPGSKGEAHRENIAEVLRAAIISEWKIVTGPAKIGHVGF